MRIMSTAALLWRSSILLVRKEKEYNVYKKGGWSDMMFRRSNLPMSYADKLFQAEDLKACVEGMLHDQNIYKSLWFYKPELIHAWEENETEDNAEAIAKHIIRMASRTTINQLFGTILTENVQNTEDYVLSAEYLKVFFTEKIMKAFDKEEIRYRFGSLLQEREAAYYISCYFEGTRKNLIFQKNTVIGKILGFIQRRGEVSGKELCNYCETFGVTKCKIKVVLELLYGIGAVITNVDVESLIFQKNKKSLEEQFFLNKEEIKKIQFLTERIKRLGKLDLKEYREEILEVEKEALELLETPFWGRIINGHSRENSAAMECRGIRINGRLKRLFSSLGTETADYQEMKEFEARFEQEYGLFQYVPILEAITLYRKISGENVRTERKQTRKYILEERIETARLTSQDEIELTPAELDEIESRGTSVVRTEEQCFDLKYQRFGNTVIFSDIAFTYPGSLFCAYLDYDEMSEKSKKQEVDYLFHCPEYLSSIGEPRGIEKGRRIRINSWEEKELDINDIGLMMDFDGIHVIDGKRKKSFIPVNPTMKSFQFQIESEIIEFLDKMGRFLSKMPSTILPIDRFSGTFIPRIRYKNMVFQTKRWNIPGKELLNGTVADCLKRHHVDRYVYLLTAKGEERYLDLESKLAQKWLRTYARKQMFVVLTEVFHGEEYCMDYIIKETFEKEQNVICNGFYRDRESVTTQHSDRYASWHIIYEQDKLQEIKKTLSRYLAETNKKYFYIYYFENGEKIIRLRIKDDVFEESMNFFKTMVQQELIQEFSYQNYHPENVRYGGLEYINKFEAIFEQESEVCIKQNPICIEKEMLHIQVAIIIAMIVNIWGEERANEFLRIHFGNISERAESVQYYQLHKMELTQRMEDDISRMSSLFFEADKRIRECLLQIGSETDAFYADYILLSLLHMRLNRVAGISQKREEKAYELAYILYKKDYARKKREREDEMVASVF